jgi:hypothetical protein
MLIEGMRGNFATLCNIRSISEHFQLEYSEATAIINDLIDIIQSNWSLIIEEAKLTKKEANLLYGTSVLNPYCFIDYK